MKSWKTTLGGLLIAVGTPLATSTMTEEWRWLNMAGTILMSVGGIVLGGAARDNNVTSEQAGAKPPAQ